MTTRKILIIEDDRLTQKLFQDNVSPYGEVIQAFTLAEAEIKFAEFQEQLTHILVDGNLGHSKNGEKPETTELVIKMCRTFTGPIIAISSEPDTNTFLKEMGCNDSVPKGHAVMYLIDLLEQEDQ